MTQLPFQKMQGTGNDFVVIDNRDIRLPMDQLIALTPKLCDRKFGIGADGLLALQDSLIADYEMIYRNADGSDAGMCGNGGRCIALFASQSGFSLEHTFSVHGNIYRAEVSTHNSTVKLYFPVTTKPTLLEQIHKNTLIQVHSGTEHIVMQIDKNALHKDELLKNVGQKLRNHAHFQPKGTNVNFFTNLEHQKLALQTYERGVEDLTLACGTGALATAIAWHCLKSISDTENTLTIETEGGPLEVSFSYESENKTYNNLSLQGAADFVFKGTISV